MGQSAPSPSDINVRPRSLDERLKEVTERLKVEADGEPSLGQTAERSLHLSPGPGPWLSRTLLAVLIVVSLIPAATIGVMLWHGEIRTPWSIDVAVGNDSQTLEAQQTSSPSPVAETLQPKQDVEALLLLSPCRAQSKPRQQRLPFRITLNSADPPLRSTLPSRGCRKARRSQMDGPTGTGDGP